jgi:hypothetical protein
VVAGWRVLVAGGSGTVTNAAAGGTISVIKLMGWRQCGQLWTARVLSPFATALTGFALFATSFGGVWTTFALFATSFGGSPFSGRPLARRRQPRALQRGLQ